MVHYRRALVPGGTFFFTVTIADRRSSILVQNIASLRHAFRVTRKERPFVIDAIVILPDHLHAIRDETDLSRHVDYIHYNPVKHALVSQVTEWPYSSFHRYVREGWLPEDWCGTIEITGKDCGERAL